MGKKMKLVAAMVLTTGAVFGCSGSEVSKDADKEVKQEANQETDKKEVRRFILFDFAFLLCPVIVSCVVSESIFAVFNSESKGLGFFSILSITILALITFALWLAYIVFRKK